MDSGCQRSANCCQSTHADSFRGLTISTANLPFRLLVRLTPAHCQRRWNSGIFHGPSPVEHCHPGLHELIETATERNANHQRLISVTVRVATVLSKLHQRPLHSGECSAADHDRQCPNGSVSAGIPTTFDGNGAIAPVLVDFGRSASPWVDLLNGRRACWAGLP